VLLESRLSLLDLQFVLCIYVSFYYSVRRENNLESQELRHKLYVKGGEGTKQLNDDFGTTRNSDLCLAL